MAHAAVSIDTAQQSGVAGYPIGIFGAGFGSSQGSGNVTILGAKVAITKWTDGVIEAVVPTAPAGVGQLVVTGNDGTSRESPFELYAVDPKFLARPTDLVNLAYKKPFVVTGQHDDRAGDPTQFLGFNDGTSSGNNHSANFYVPFTVATDLGSALSEDVWFAWYCNPGSSWPEGGTLPASYTIDASADSTDGKGGAWTTLKAVSGYTRKHRIDKVTLSGQRWIRMRVTAYYGTETAVSLAEVRVYKRKAPGGTGVDAIGLIGDSITYADHRETGPDAFYELIHDARNDATNTAGFPMGTIGQNTGAWTIHTGRRPSTI